MPDISQSLVEQIKTATAEKTPITIVGNGTKQAMGRKVELGKEQLETTRHSGIVDYKPVELIMTARAGTTLAEIDSELAKNNQMLACDPRRFGGQATLGGSLASNQSGHARPWFGSIRDHVLGIRLINGHGQHLRFGGQVMKNVAGYDVSRLQAGAMGALGLITEMSFKVLPKSEASISLSVPAGAQDALILMNTLARTAKPITAASWIDNHVYVRLEGVNAAVSAAALQWQSQHGFTLLSEDEATIFWDSLREHEHDFFAGKEDEKTLWKFSVNASAKAIETDADWAFNWCGSQRWLIGEFNLSELSEQAKAMGGQVQHFSGGDRQQDVFEPSNAALKALMKNVKESFDPENIFNPGRLYSWL